MPWTAENPAIFSMKLMYPNPGSNLPGLGIEEKDLKERKEKWNLLFHSAQE